jgi:hypothetical protein
VREHESACPFCRAALPEAPALAARAPSPAGLSRAAVFAMRTALVAAAPGALACGDEEGSRPRGTLQDVASAGASGAGQGGSSAGSSAGTSGTGGAIALAPADSDADAGADAEPYAPIPIYGGVFPDPMSRARV